MRSLAVDTIGEMLASDESVFTADDDIELIGEALPFSLKLVESLLAESPDQTGTDDQQANAQQNGNQRTGQESLES